MKDVQNFFNMWIGMIEEYNTISINEEDSFTRQYEEEFYHEFEIVDADADTSAFDHKRQMAIYKLLSAIESKLKLDYPNDQEITAIIEETKELKNNIQNRTKRAVVKGLSKIMAKIKKHSLKYLQEFWDETRKEAYKQLLRGGDDIAEAMTNLFN